MGADNVMTHTVLKACVNNWNRLQGESLCNPSPPRGKSTPSASDQHLRAPPAPRAAASLSHADAPSAPHNPSRAALLPLAPLLHALRPPVAARAFP